MLLGIHPFGDVCGDVCGDTCAHTLLLVSSLMQLHVLQVTIYFCRIKSRLPSIRTEKRPTH
jgi:hypothetical protein